MIEDSRHFIRHPSAIPLEFKLGGCAQTKSLKDISKGGLCFVSATELPIGEVIQIQINSCQPCFEAEGIVRWCRPNSENDFLVGVAFNDEKVQFAMRMVEQICHIEAYRYKVMARTGVTLSIDQAAREWIRKHAADFPTFDD